MILGLGPSSGSIPGAALVSLAAEWARSASGCREASRTTPTIEIARWHVIFVHMAGIISIPHRCCSLVSWQRRPGRVRPALWRPESGPHRNACGARYTTGCCGHTALFICCSPAPRCGEWEGNGPCRPPIRTGVPVWAAAGVSRWRGALSCAGRQQRAAPGAGGEPRQCARNGAHTLARRVARRGRDAGPVYPIIIAPSPGSQGGGGGR